MINNKYCWPVRVYRNICPNDNKYAYIHASQSIYIPRPPRTNTHTRMRAHKHTLTLTRTRTKEKMGVFTGPVYISTYCQQKSSCYAQQESKEAVPLQLFIVCFLLLNVSD